jgi:hypothetical protein
MANIVAGVKIVGMKQLETKLQQAFENWAEKDVNDQYWKEQFLERDWPYPGTTKRKNPNAPIVEAGDPRDIYDYGKLYQSGKESLEIASNTTSVTASWDWNAKNSSGQLYAYYVHEGAAKAGNNLVARRWTDALVIPDLFLASDLSKLFKRRIEDQFRK